MKYFPEISIFLAGFYLHELAVIRVFLTAGQPGVGGYGVPSGPGEALALRAGHTPLVGLPGWLWSVGAAIVTSPLILPAASALTAAAAAQL